MAGLIYADASLKLWCYVLLHIFIGYQMKYKHGKITAAFYCVMSIRRIYRLSLPSTGLQRYITNTVSVREFILFFLQQVIENIPSHTQALFLQGVFTFQVSWAVNMMSWSLEEKVLFLWKLAVCKSGFLCRPKAD